MHEGEWSSRLGIPGQPAEAEELMVIRDIALARLTGARIHFQHLSTAGSVGMVRGGQGGRAAGHRRGRAPPLHAHRRRAAPATTPCSRCNPPLRTAADVAAVRGRAGRRLDRRHRHRPRPAPRRRRRSARSTRRRPGCSGSSTPWRWRSPSSAWTSPTCSRCMSWQPAAIAGVGDRHGVPVVEGAAGEPLRDRPRRHVDDRRSGGASRSSNVPYVGRTVRGRVRHTFLAGEPVVLDGAPQR